MDFSDARRVKSSNLFCISLKVRNKLCTLSVFTMTFAILVHDWLILEVWGGINQSLARIIKHTFFYDPYPFCAYFDIYIQLSLQIGAKRVGFMNNKMCVLKIQDTLLL